MKIRGSPAAAAAASSAIESPCPLASPSVAQYTPLTTSTTTNQTTSSSSSCFSSSTHSTISTYSLTSSSNSASCSSYATDSPSKCEGLDLLVKAVYYVVAGSVVGVPYIQRRVIRRRKRALNFSNLIVGGSLNSADDEVKLEEDVEEEVKERKSKRRKTEVNCLLGNYKNLLFSNRGSHQQRRPQSKRRCRGAEDDGVGEFRRVDLGNG